MKAHTIMTDGVSSKVVTAWIATYMSDMSANYIPTSQFQEQKLF